MDYNDIKLYLRSTTQDDATSHWPVIESVVPVSAHFVPVSSDVTLRIDHQVVNTATGTTVNFQVSGFDLNFLPDDVVGTFASPIILTNDKNITGIKEMEGIENGAGAVYDLQGRRVDSSIPKKGIYIVDGYKVVVK